jgi:hypothetical protein
MCSGSHFLQKLGSEHTTLKMETGRDQVKKHSTVALCTDSFKFQEVTVKVREVATAHSFLQLAMASCKLQLIRCWDWQFMC